MVYMGVAGGGGSCGLSLSLKFHVSLGELPIFLRWPVKFFETVLLKLFDDDFIDLFLITI